MRESKYRGFSKENNSWVYGSLLRGMFFYSSHGTKNANNPYGEILYIVDPNSGGYDSFEEIENITHEVEYSSVGEYTGLKDKNGKEIFEGDIIYWEIDNGVGIESYSAVVRWSENTEKYKNIYKWLVVYTTDYLRGDFDELTTPAAYNDGLQVIGNIYENPELLEGTA